MDNKDLQEYKIKLGNLSVNEQKMRDLYLRKLALGEIQGPPTSYASIDKPWLKWYNEDKINIDIPNSNAYDYLLENTSNEYPLINYYGKIYYKKDIQKEVDKYIRKFLTIGIKENDSVSFMMLNVPEVFFMWLALSKIGANANLIKFDEGPERIAFMNNVGKSNYMFVSEVPFIVDNVNKSLEYETSIKEVISIPITNSMTKVSLVDMILEEGKKQSKDKNINLIKGIKKYLDDFKEENNRTRKIIERQAKFISYKEWINKYKDSITDGIEGGKDYVSVIVYTGGTTGSPKGVEITNNNIISMAHAFKYSDFGFNPGKKSLNILPPGPAYYLNATYALICCNVEVNMIFNFTVDEYPTLISKYKPNIFLSGPILLRKMVEKDVLKDASFITAPISGGDKLHLSEEEKINAYFKSRNSNAIVHQGYGESESTAAATYSKDNAATVGGIGIPMINVEVAIFEYQSYEDYLKFGNMEKPYNEIGEICITGPTIMKGYRDNQQETAYVLRKHEDGKYWLHTDDLGYMDKDGRLFHCGRAKRMLTRSGAKVWLGALEDVIKKHPNILDCCCVRLNDEIEREVPVCHVVLKNQTLISTFDEIDEMIKEAYPETYIPKYYIIRNSIPITKVNNKVDFKKLENEDIFNNLTIERKNKILQKKF